MKKKMTIDEIIEAARREAATATSWADFSNFLFDPEDGLISGLYPSQAERERARVTVFREDSGAVGLSGRDPSWKPAAGN